jgi:hypothetical protein
VDQLDPGDIRRTNLSEDVMKRFLTLMLAGMFTLSLVGCHAEADVDDNNHDDVSMKKTTKVERDGDTKTTYQKTTVDR